MKQICRFADNINTWPEEMKSLLTKLSSDEYWPIHCGVAKNPNTPGEVLTKLSSDEEKKNARRIT